MGVVSDNVQEAGGSARGIPQTGDGSEGQSVEGRDLEKQCSGEGYQGSRNPDTGGVH